MPKVRIISNKLDSFMRFAKERLGKPVIVKACEGISREGAAGRSYPLRQHKFSVIPVYISTGGKIFDNHDKITDYGEEVVAHEVAHQIAHSEGFGEVNFGALEYVTGLKVKKGQEQLLEAVLTIFFKDIPNRIYNFVSHLRVHNIVAEHGFNPSIIYRTILNDNDPLSYNGSFHKIAGEFTRFGLDIHRYPKVVRVILLQGILTLAEYYLFLDEQEREQLIEKLNPVLRSELVSFLRNLSLDVKCAYLLGNEHREKFTPEAYFKLADDIVSYFGSGGLIIQHPLTLKEVDQAKLAFATKFVLAGLLYSAYEETATITETDVSKQLLIIQEVLIRNAYRAIGSNSFRKAVKYVATAFADNEMIDSAIYFCENTLGVNEEFYF